MLYTHIINFSRFYVDTSECLRGKKIIKFLKIKVNYENFRIYNVKFK
jgi:hypothetical protein